MAETKTKLSFNQNKIDFQSPKVRKHIDDVKKEAKKVIESTRVDLSKLRASFEV